MEDIRIKIYFKSTIFEKEGDKKICLDGFKLLYPRRFNFEKKYNLDDYKTEKYTRLDQRYEIPLDKLYEMIGRTREEAATICAKSVYFDNNLSAEDIKMGDYYSGLAPLNDFFVEIERKNEIEKIALEINHY